MPVVETKGSASSQGFGEFAKSGGAANYIEDVFSTYLYTGNSLTQTITNGIDLAGKGGLVWGKSRNNSSGNNNHYLEDTNRGPSQFLFSNLTNAQNYSPTEGISSFNANGFSLLGGGRMNASGDTMVSWTFRKQAKFFDVVTYTGNGANARAINHNLGSVPGCIIVKSLNAADDWYVYHQSLGATNAILLNSIGSASAFPDYWSNTSPTATQFTLGTSSGGVTNVSGRTYVAYLFAHNAGGFGLTGTDNVISCGSVSVASGTSNAVVNLGYEPQWVLWRNADVTDNWYIFDNMRGIGAFNTAQQLNPNLSGAESAIGSSTYPVNITSTGFSFNAGNFGWGASSNKFIYVAIRRGPMKTPTSGTSVFSPIARTGTGLNNQTVTGVGFPPDLSFTKARTDTYPFQWYDRLRGKALRIESNSTGAEINDGSYGVQTFGQNGITYGLSDGGYNTGGGTYINYFLLRAPSFFDEVCYTGDGTNNRAITHNLGVAPELAIIKARNRVDNWVVRSSAFPTSGSSGIAYLDLSDAVTNAGDSYSPTSTTFTVHNNNNQNGSTYTYVAYLFASCSGVSKVGTYTGTGATQTINCGFAARFVMIKRTDTSGYGWIVWDTARGMVAGTDPFLLLNLTNAENNTSNTVYTNASGFQIVTTTALGINANGGKYIYLAIA